MKTRITRYIARFSRPLVKKYSVRSRISLTLIGIACIGLVGILPAQTGNAQNVLHVKADAVGANNGTNWADAYSDLQDALAAAVVGDQIWVARGMYTPGGPGDRNATFQLKNGVGVYGGFAGIEDSPSERDPATNLTVLSGDLNGNDSKVLETTELVGESTRSDNSYHVVTGSGADETAVLDGFLITGGNANASRNNHGGGMINVSSAGGSVPANPTIANCTFHGNSARRKGGGMYNEAGAPSLDNCIFRENHSHASSYEEGGGGLFNEGGSPSLWRCRFVGNTTTSGGAGVYNRFASPIILDTVFDRNAVTAILTTQTGGGILNNSSDATIADCTFTGNSASHGGGVENWLTPASTFVNCLFIKNRAAMPGNGDGGGLQSWGSGCTPHVINCTFVENTASDLGGGLGAAGGAGATVSNCIFWGNRARSEAVAQIGTGPIVATYSCVQGGRSGEGNINADPQFVMPGHWGDANDPSIMLDPDDPNAVWIEGDYHLKSSAGRWDPYSESWVMDDVTSPCIDRGNPNSPIGDEADPHGDIINMGAYGGTPEASMSTLPPLAHWKLDETEGDVAYDSAAENDAVIFGDALWQPAGGQIDGALQLDGIDDYIDTQFSLNPSEGLFSVFAWVKGDAPGQVILSQQGGANWLLVRSDGTLMTELTRYRGRQVGPLHSEATITDGNWHRIGLVRSASQRTLYVDNVIVAQDDQDSLEGASGSLYIGASPGLQAGSLWSGMIDDVQIYGRVIIP